MGVGSCGLEGAIESLLAGSGQGLNDRESDFGVLEIPQEKNRKIPKFLKIKIKKTLNWMALALLTSAAFLRTEVLTMWMEPGSVLWFPLISWSFLKFNFFCPKKKKKIFKKIFFFFIYTKLRNCSIQGNVSELLVHVMESGSGLHAQHDSVGFHVSGVLLVDL